MIALAVEIHKVLKPVLLHDLGQVVVLEVLNKKKELRILKVGVRPGNLIILKVRSRQKIQTH